MRKFMILLFVVVATMNMYAQIAVSDRGHVGIGVTTSNAFLNIKGKSNASSCIYCYPNTCTTGMYIGNGNTTSTTTFGLQVEKNN